VGYGEIKLQAPLSQESRAVRPLRHDLTDRLKPGFTGSLLPRC
jgi:hypothetical protein